MHNFEVQGSWFRVQAKKGWAPLHQKASQSLGFLHFKPFASKHDSLQASKPLFLYPLSFLHYPCANIFISFSLRRQADPQKLSVEICVYPCPNIL
jgi:hypothetical protein